MAKTKNSNLKRNLFVLISFVLLFTYLFVSEDIASLTTSLNTIDWWYVLLGLVFTILFILFDAMAVFLFRKGLQKDASFSTSLKASFISIGLGFVTPFQSGYLAGQITVLGKNGMTASDAATVVLKKTIRYLSFGLVVNIALIVMDRNIFDINTPVLIMIIFSITATFLYLIFLMLVSKAEKGLTKVALAVLKISHKMHLIKNYEKLKKKVVEEILLLKDRMASHHISFSQNIKAFIFSMGQLGSLYLVTWAVYMAFNYNNPTFTVLQVMGGQGLCNVILQVSPIPGGIGLVDAAFTNVMTVIMGCHLNIAMIIWRLLTLYLPISISFLLLGSVSRKKQKGKETEVTD